VYGLLDGNTTQKAIADATRVPKTTVNRHVAAFLRGGLAVPPSEYYENPRALFTLEELGLEFGDSTASEEVSATVTTA
jgi:DNA-binding IclR family transcriptional regulator